MGILNPYYWVDDNPLLQVIIWKQWEFRPQHTWKHNLNKFRPKPAPKPQPCKRPPHGTAWSLFVPGRGRRCPGCPRCHKSCVPYLAIYGTLVDSGMYTLLRTITLTYPLRKADTFEERWFFRTSLSVGSGNSLPGGYRCLSPLSIKGHEKWSPVCWGTSKRYRCHWWHESSVMGPLDRGFVFGGKSKHQTSRKGHLDQNMP